MAKKGFNLLQPQEAPPTFWDKIYAWVLGTARVIIIAVELVVLGVFVGRFIVDGNTKNLDEQISVEQRRLDALATKEESFRKIQNKLAVYEEMWVGASSYTSVLREIDTYLPSSSADITLQVSGRDLVIRGFADLTAISSLEKSMKSSDSFERVEVFEVQEQGGGQVGGVFAVRGVIDDTNLRIF